MDRHRYLEQGHEQLKRVPDAEVCGAYYALRDECSATDTGSRAARMDGARPPMKPINRANRMPSMSRSGVIWKANATLEKVCQLMVEVV